MVPHLFAQSFWSWVLVVVLVAPEKQRERTKTKVAASLRQAVSRQELTKHRETDETVGLGPRGRSMGAEMHLFLIASCYSIGWAGSGRCRGVLVAMVRLVSCMRRSMAMSMT